MLPYPNFDPMKRYALTLDLKNDPELIRQYEDHHRSVWPEVAASIHESGILHMEIYRYQTRLFMLMETTDDFSFEKKARADKENPVVQKWEELMWKYQQPFADAAAGEKWRRMDKICDLP